MRAPKPADPKRSALMGRVRQKGTAAERRVAALLKSFGASYRLNVGSLPGSPDFANRKRRWAVFVNGCFWHHHTGCARATVPKTNDAFWREKFAANRARDAKAVRTLRKSGFSVVVVWECEVDISSRVARKLSKVLETRRVCMRQSIDHGSVVVDVARLRGRR